MTGRWKRGNMRGERKRGMLYGNGCIAIAYIIEQQTGGGGIPYVYWAYAMPHRGSAGNAKDSYARRSIFRGQPGIIIVP